MDVLQIGYTEKHAHYNRLKTGCMESEAKTPTQGVGGANDERYSHRDYDARLCSGLFSLRRNQLQKLGNINPLTPTVAIWGQL